MKALIVAVVAVLALSGAARADDYMDKNQFRSHIVQMTKAQVIATLGAPRHTAEWPNGTVSWFYYLGDQSHIYDADTRKPVTDLVINWSATGEVNRVTLDN